MNDDTRILQLGTLYGYPLSVTIKAKRTGLLIVKHGVLFIGRCKPNTCFANWHRAKDDGMIYTRGISKNRKWRENTLGIEFTWIELFTHPLRSFAQFYTILRHA
jgi:hypothetical protein